MSVRPKPKQTSAPASKATSVLSGGHTINATSTITFDDKGAFVLNHDVPIAIPDKAVSVGGKPTGLCGRPQSTIKKEEPTMQQLKADNQKLRQLVAVKDKQIEKLEYLQNSTGLEQGENQYKISCHLDIIVDGVMDNCTERAVITKNHSYNAYLVLNEVSGFEESLANLTNVSMAVIIKRTAEYSWVFKDMNDTSGAGAGDIEFTSDANSGVTIKRMEGQPQAVNIAIDLSTSGGISNLLTKIDQQPCEGPLQVFGQSGARFYMKVGNIKFNTQAKCGRGGGNGDMGQLLMDTITYANNNSIQSTTKNVRFTPFNISTDGLPFYTATVLSSNEKSQVKEDRQNNGKPVIFSEEKRDGTDTLVESLSFFASQLSLTNGSNPHLMLK